MVLLLVLAVVLLLRWYGDLVSQSSQVSPEGVRGA